MRDKKRISFTKSNIAWLVGLVLLFLPYAISVLYSIPGADDFSMAGDIDTSHILTSAIDKANYMYMNWAGGWPYVFLEGFLNPLILFGRQLQWMGLEMLIFFALFFLSVWLLLKIYLETICRDTTYLLPLYFFACLAIFISDTYTEIFYWFVGSTYMWGMTLSFLIISLALKFFRSETKQYQKSYAVIIAIIGFLTCFNFQIAVIPGMAYFLLWLADTRENRQSQHWVKTMLPLLAMVLGGLFGLLAPGNFSRHSAIDSTGIHVGLGAWFAFKDYLLTIFWLLVKPVVLFAVVAILVIGYSVAKRKAAKQDDYSFHPIIPFIIATITVYLTCFPLALGYSKTEITNRMAFIFNVEAILSYGASCLYLGGWMYVRHHAAWEKKDWRKIGIILTILFALCLILTGLYRDTTYYKYLTSMDQVVSGSAKWQSILDTLATTEESDVVLEIERFDTPILNTPLVNQTTSDDYFDGSYMCNFYNKDSIQIIWK